MKITQTIQADVLIIGAGLAGVSAAIAAGSAGASVALLSAGSIFSGSSFYPGTWGFGLIGPESDADREDLKKTIRETGMGMADEGLVDTLVDGIQESVAELQGFGIPLKRPENGGQREYIPCFDHKNRDWYGLVQKEARAGLGRMLDRYAAALFPQTQVLELITGNRVLGALALTPQGLVRFACKSCVIATGGLGGLFEHALTTPDVCGMGQYLALRAGARLVNLEFHQMMPGYVSPCPKTIYNEKVFRCTSFFHPETGESLFADCPPEEVRRLLEIRSGHGPFTSRLDSREVDIRLYAAFMQCPEGVPIRYENIPDPMPEFVQTYFHWLEREKGVTEKDEARLGIFYHAANGGIMIDRQGFTGVEGLYACGECTGGMHGADRLGGLSTANGLVFGRIAGHSAAKAAKELEMPVFSGDSASLWQVKDAQTLLEGLRTLNSYSCMIFRSGQVIKKALNMTRTITDALRPLEANTFTPKLAESYRLFAALAISKAMQTAVDLRRESRGSHYRADFPAPDPKYEKRILLSIERERVQACFEWRGAAESHETRDNP